MHGGAALPILSDSYNLTRLLSIPLSLGKSFGVMMGLHNLHSLWKGPFLLPLIEATRHCFPALRRFALGDRSHRISCLPSEAFCIAMEEANPPHGER